MDYHKQNYAGFIPRATEIISWLEEYCEREPDENMLQNSTCVLDGLGKMIQIANRKLKHNEKEESLKNNWMQRLVEEGYPISGGGGIPSDYQTQQKNVGRKI